MKVVANVGVGWIQRRAVGSLQRGQLTFQRASSSSATSCWARCSCVPNTPTRVRVRCQTPSWSASLRKSDGDPRYRWPRSSGVDVSNLASYMSEFGTVIWDVCIAKMRTNDQTKCSYFCPQR
jgi:hypothetical protein